MIISVFKSFFFCYVLNHSSNFKSIIFGSFLIFYHSYNIHTLSERLRPFLHFLILLSEFNVVIETEKTLLIKNSVNFNNFSGL